jgi:mRNA interferase MazF
MPQISVHLNHANDERILRRLVTHLNSNTESAKTLRLLAQDTPKHTKGILFQPRPGQILICDFTTGFRVPEMVKKRPVLVVSPKKSRWDKICVVLPISSKAPTTQLPQRETSRLLDQG